jgi:hypothetical protein
MLEGRRRGLVGTRSRNMCRSAGRDGIGAGIDRIRSGCWYRRSGRGIWPGLRGWCRKTDRSHGSDGSHGGVRVRDIGLGIWVTDCMSRSRSGDVIGHRRSISYIIARCSRRGGTRLSYRRNSSRCRCRSHGHRDASGGKKTIPTDRKVDLTTRLSGVVGRCQLEERHGFLNETLRSEEICVLEVAIVQRRQLVRASGRLGGPARLCKVGIGVLDSTPEHRDFLNKGLKSVRVRIVTRLASMIFVL